MYHNHLKMVLGQKSRQFQIVSWESNSTSGGKGKVCGFKIQYIRFLKPTVQTFSFCHMTNHRPYKIACLHIITMPYQYTQLAYLINKSVSLCKSNLNAYCIHSIEYQGYLLIFDLNESTIIRRSQSLDRCAH